jgi:uncharacterized protein with HEPN domain
MSKRDLTLLLEDMLTAAYKIQKYTAYMAYDGFIEHPGGYLKRTSPSIL